MVTQISYAPDTKILNGQLSLGLAVLPGVSSSQVGATAAFGSLAAEGRRSQTVAGFGDLYPVASLAWNQGVNNYMAYVTGDIPVGLYGPSNFSNLGIGHGAIDGGGGYTYLDPTSGVKSQPSSARHSTSSIRRPITPTASIFISTGPLLNFSVSSGKSASSATSTTR